jgi:ADP-ribosylglycohydrolase
MRKVGGRFWAARERVDAGSYSDDTQLLVATTRALARGGADWFAWFTQGELPAWLVYERGGGRATKAAAQLWAQRTPPWHAPTHAGREKYFGAGGNGVAMRVLPHAFAATTWEGLRQDVLANGTATHGHPHALIGALLYAAAAKLAIDKIGRWDLGELLELAERERHFWMQPPTASETLPGWYDAALEATRGRYNHQWSKAAEDTADALLRVADAVHQGIIVPDDLVLDGLGARNPKVRGSGTVSALAAMFVAARYAADPATGLRVAAYASGIDSDTIASMAGGLLGAMVGDAWMPPLWRDVQDASFLQRLADGLWSDSRDGRRSLFDGWHEGDVWTEAHSRRFRETLAGGRDEEHILGPLGPVSVVEREELEPVARGVRMTRYHVRTRDGQLVFVLRGQRTTSSERASYPHVRPLVTSERPAGSQVGSGQGREETTRMPPRGAHLAEPPRDSQLSGAIEGGVGREARRWQSDLSQIGGALPEDASARMLLTLLQETIEALQELRVGHESRTTWSSEEVTARVAAAMEAAGRPRLPTEVLLPLARIAWRLVATTGAKRHGRNSEEP